MSWAKSSEKHNGMASQASMCHRHTCETGQSVGQEGVNANWQTKEGAEHKKIGDIDSQQVAGRSRAKGWFD